MIQPIKISNCPYTGSIRKVKYKFSWDPFDSESITVDCTICYFDVNDNPIPESAIPSFNKILIANNSYVIDITTGRLVIGADPNNLGANQMKQYGFMIALTLAYMVGVTIDTPLSDDITSLIVLNIMDADSRQVFDNRTNNNVID